jgi:hypothetical protein
VDRDLSKIIDAIDKRLYELELSVTSPAVMASGGSFPGGITIGDGTGSEVVIDFNPPEQPDSLSVDVGAVYDNIYADVEWEPSVTGPLTQSYVVTWHLGDSGAGSFVGNAVVAGTSYRIENLEPNTDYSVRVTPTSNIGVIGTATPWLDFTTATDTTIPPAPTGVVIGRGATTVVVKYTPLTAIQARDVANGAGIYEIEIDTTNTFGSGNLRSMRSSDQIVSFSDVLVETAWYARVRAIDSSGNASLWSAVVGPSTAGGVIDAMIVSGLDAAKITFGQMSGSRIVVNTLSADRLAAGTITSAAIILGTNGYLWSGTGLGGATPTGTLVSEDGVILFKNGAISAWLNASTGNASFSGAISAATITGSTISGTTISGTNISGGTIIGSNIQTASSGERITLGPLWGASVIQQYGAAPLVMPATYEVGTFGPNGGYALSISGPTGGLGESAGRIYLETYVGAAYVYIVGRTHVAGTFTAGTKSFRIPHPSKQGLDLQHGSLEGPEHGVFYRGRAKTKGKKKVVKLPAYFTALVMSNRGVDVFVSPRDKPCAVFAGDVVDGQFMVQSSEDCEFSWVAFASRQDVEIELPALPEVH